MFNLCSSTWPKSQLRADWAQEAGILGVVPLSGIPRIQMLGLFPTTETVLAQLVAIAILVAGFWLNRKTTVRET